MVHERFSKNYDSLKAAAREAPQEAGVYIMRDGENRIIYVGKARILRNRLNSYFSGEKDIKTSILMKRVMSIETIIVSNEYEALLLENTLIKQHSPKYNINLKDGKTYPVIRITAEDFPRVFRTRQIVENGSRYFGPFPNIQAVDLMLELTDKLFPLRKCRTLRKREAPCMYYHIGRCAAPCCGKISKEDYARCVERVEQLLSGETGALIRELSREMGTAAKELHFERAAQLRDAVKALEDLSRGAAMVDFDEEGRDYIAWASEGIFTSYSVFSMRGGKMTGRELFRTRSAADEEESLETFAAAYYTRDRPPPPRIYLSLDHSGDVHAGAATNAGGGPPAVSGTAGPGGVHAGGTRKPQETDPQWPEKAGRHGRRLEGLHRWFAGQFGREPALCSPDEKRHAAILAMVRQNALEDLRLRLKERGAGPALDELIRHLALRRRPERIEGFDIAQLDGKHPAASLISFKNGIPDRKQYRYFKLRTVIGVVDDFAAMREAVRRRYSRLIREGRDLPDLILIDGGIGQVNAAKGVLDELGVDCDVAGLAKRDEEIWLPGAKTPLRLSRDSEALKLLQFVRDETHRFATSFNQRLRSRDLSFPALESVEGIGPKRAAALMKAYGSIEALAAAPAGDIAGRCGLSAAAARAVRAAAALALEDRKNAGKRLASPGRSRRRIYGDTAGAADAATLAAEAAADYGKNGPG
jgi:excinuclease ABC subunit C